MNVRTRKIDEPAVCALHADIIFAIYCAALTQKHQNKGAADSQGPGSSGPRAGGAHRNVPGCSGAGAARRSEPAPRAWRALSSETSWTSCRWPSAGQTEEMEELKTHRYFRL